jgi:hypothetical protein
MTTFGLAIGVVQPHLNKANETNQASAGNNDLLISLALGGSNCFLFFGELPASAGS